MQAPQVPQYPQYPQWSYNGYGYRRYYSNCRKGGKFFVGLVIGGVAGYVFGQNKALKRELYYNQYYQYGPGWRNEGMNRPVDHPERRSGESDVKSTSTEEATKEK